MDKGPRGQVLEDRTRRVRRPLTSEQIFSLSVVLRRLNPKFTDDDIKWKLRYGDLRFLERDNAGKFIMRLQREVKK